LYPVFYRLHIVDGLLQLSPSKESQECFPPDCSFNPIRVRSVIHAKEVDTRILGEYLLFGSFTEAWAAGCALADMQWNSESMPEDGFEPEGDDALRTLGRCAECSTAKPLANMTRLR